jgi:hypothetical protein
MDAGGQPARDLFIQGHAGQGLPAEVLTEGLPEEIRRHQELGREEVCLSFDLRSMFLEALAVEVGRIPEEADLLPFDGVENQVAQLVGGGKAEDFGAEVAGDGDGFRDRIKLPGELLEAEVSGGIFDKVGNLLFLFVVDVLQPSGGRGLDDLEGRCGGLGPDLKATLVQVG